MGDTGFRETGEEGRGKPGLIGEAVRAGKSFLKGMGVTFREMVFEEPVTVQYPEERPEVPSWFRGIPVQKTDLATGEYKCTACGLCVEACPVNVITLEWHQDENKRKVVDRYAIDMSRCLVCNYCIEACPFDALVMAYDYELSVVDPEHMVYEFEDLLRLGLKYSTVGEPGPGGQPVRGKPTWLFAPITGATEADILDPKGYLGRPPISPKIRKEYVSQVLEAHGISDNGTREAREETQVSKQVAAHTITKDTPTHVPVVNPNPKTVSAAGGPARISAPDAEVASPAEADEVRPDQMPKEPPH